MPEMLRTPARCPRSGQMLMVQERPAVPRADAMVRSEPDSALCISGYTEVFGGPSSSAAPVVEAALRPEPWEHTGSALGPPPHRWVLLQGLPLSGLQGGKTATPGPTQCSHLHSLCLINCPQ